MIMMKLTIHQPIIHLDDDEEALLLYDQEEINLPVMKNHLKHI